MAQVTTEHAAASAASFINSIGVCGTADATTAAQLVYLGINHLRTNTISAADLLAAGADGAKMDVIFPYYMGNVTTVTIANFLSLINPAASVIDAVEGPNEVNNDPDTFYGLSGPAAMEGIQEALFTLSKADVALNNATHATAVYDFSVGVGTSTAIYSGMSAYADDNNVHAYGSDGVPPSWFLPDSVSLNVIAGAQPVVITETGYETMPASGVDQATQARLDIDSLLDAYQLGVTTTYLYDIQDWATGVSVSDFSAYYGLYTTDGTPKLAAIAIHNLTTILSNGDTASSSAAGGSLNYTISGLVYYSNTELFSKPGGSYDLVIWNETTEWDPSDNQEIAIPSNTVTLTLGQVFGTILVYDPLVSSSPIATWSNTSTAVMSLGGDPLIIEMTPAMTATASSQMVTTTDAATAAPFRSVVINDPNTRQTETAIVTLSATENGTLSDPNAATDGGIFSNGTYRVSGSATAVASALDGLLFTPRAHQVAPGLTITTTFTAMITDTAGTQTTITSTVNATALNTTPTIPSPITRIIKYEGQATYTPANGTRIAGTAEAVQLTNGVDQTLVVLPDQAPNPGNPNHDGITIHGARNASLIDLTGATGYDAVSVGGAGETVKGGSGHTFIYVTGATIGAPIDGGSGAAQLTVRGGGTAIMGNSITRIGGVILADPTSGTVQPAYAFTANTIAGLHIQGSSGNDTITLGGVGQRVTAGGGDDHIIASAADAGGLIDGGTGSNTLEITTGGPVTLDAHTTNVTVMLDGLSELTLSKMGFISAFGEVAGNTITAQAAGQTLGGDAGHDVLYGYTGFGDTFAGTTSGLDQDTIYHLGGNDLIDVTDLGNATASYSASRPTSQYGVLAVTNGTHSLSIGLSGSFDPTQFHSGSDGHSGTSITYG